MAEIPKAIKFEDHCLYALDQRKLPSQEVYVKVESLEDCFEVIRDMVVRGAPLIGFSALYGLVLWAQKNPELNLSECRKACDYLSKARPTAVNLEFELNNVYEVLSTKKHLFSDRAELVQWLKTWADFAVSDLELKNRKAAKSAEEALKRIYPNKTSFRLMTLCNTGYLACGTLGTALGVISHLHSLDKVDMVYACETRPYLQGARLSAYELGKEKIPYQLIVEGAISSVLKTQNIDAIFVGADRIAANGDTANKVGTSTLAIAADYYDVPFFVVAPLSSFDLSIANGENIEIEERPMEEVTTFDGHSIAPQQARAFNPSFDVTDHSHIRSLFCEKGEICPVGRENIIKTLGQLGDVKC